MNVKNITSNERSQMPEYILYGSIYIKFKNMQINIWAWKSEYQLSFWGYDDWEGAQGNFLGWLKISVSWSGWRLHRQNLIELYVYLRFVHFTVYGIHLNLKKERIWRGKLSHVMLHIYFACQNIPTLSDLL